MELVTLDMNNKEVVGSWKAWMDFVVVVQPTEVGPFQNPTDAAQ